MTRALRVLMVNDLPPGQGSGAEVAMTRLVTGLQRRGDDVHLFYPSVPHLGARRVLDLWDPAARRGLARRAAELRPDVVHHHNVLRELSVSVLGVPRGVPCVLTVHDHRLVGDADGGLRGLRGAVDRLVKSPLDRRVARSAVDATLAVSAGLGTRLIAAGFRGVTVVDNPGGDAGPEPSPPSRSTTVLYAGRLSADKGVDVLLTAWPAIAREHPSAQLLVVGSGPAAADLSREVAALPRVQLAGRLPAADLAERMRSVRVVCVPSLPARRPEGTPLVAVEAALAGRGLVVSDDPGLADLVGRLGAGAVVPAGDAAALAAAICARLRDDALVDEEGARLRAAAGRCCTTDAVTDQVRRVYESVCRG